MSFKMNGVTPGARWTPKGYQQITNAAGPSIVQTLTVPSKALFCTLQSVGCANARFTDVTSSQPSTAFGQIIPPSTALPMIYGGDPAMLQLNVTAGTVEVLYYA